MKKMSCKEKQKLIYGKMIELFEKYNEKKEFLAGRFIDDFLDWIQDIL